MENTIYFADFLFMEPKIWNISDWSFEMPVHFISI